MSDEEIEKTSGDEDFEAPINEISEEIDEGNKQLIRNILENAGVGGEGIMYLITQYYGRWPELDQIYDGLREIDKEIKHIPSTKSENIPRTNILLSDFWKKKEDLREKASAFLMEKAKS